MLQVQIAASMPSTKSFTGPEATLKKEEFAPYTEQTPPSPAPTGATAPDTLISPTGVPLEITQRNSKKSFANTGEILSSSFSFPLLF